MNCAKQTKGQPLVFDENSCVELSRMRVERARSVSSNSIVRNPGDIENE